MEDKGKFEQQWLRDFLSDREKEIFDKCIFSIAKFFYPDGEPSIELLDYIYIEIARVVIYLKSENK
jgi:hypothetical protein